MGSIAAELKYSMYLSVHPFKGFWDIKHEKRGSVRTGMILLALFLITNVANGYYDGYLFNSNGGVNFNAVFNVGQWLILFLMWCISNWCLTSLFDGEGTFADICRSTSYALIPLIINNILAIPLTNSLSLKEAGFLSLINTICMVWFLFLIIVGNVVTHQYSLSQTLLLMIITICGVAIITYIALLFLYMIQSVVLFVVVLMREINLRMS